MVGKREREEEKRKKGAKEKREKKEEKTGKRDEKEKIPEKIVSGLFLFILSEGSEFCSCEKKESKEHQKKG